MESMSSLLYSTKMMTNVLDYWLDYLDVNQLETDEGITFDFFVRSRERENIRSGSFFTIDNGLATPGIDIVGTSGLGC